MKFEELQKRARERWEALQNSPKPRILVGAATCGRAAGALAVIDALHEALDKHGVEADIMQVGCIGFCYAEVLVDIIKPGRPRICYQSVTPKIAATLVEDYLVKDNPRPDLALCVVGEGSVEGILAFKDLPMMRGQVRVAGRNCGHIDPTDIDHYLANGGYVGFVKALGMTPQEVIETTKRSGLRGRGGAGFPTGQKWEFCRNATGTPKYLICNADEGDPGAFMDRSLLEGDPHSVLEGMLIGAYAIGSEEGYIYVRAEYPLAIERLIRAIEQMEDYGLLGENILGSGFNFHLKIKEGAGAFVCGEETALMASIEGKRGMPRSRPPFPANAGLWGKPSNVNNVETFANVPEIFSKGADWYAAYGQDRSKGTKTFALAGKINRTGLIEVPLGITLREVIFDIGGGIPDGKKFKAAQTGGPIGGCIPESLLDLPIGFESLTAAGALMGSGGLVIMDEDTCMVDVARYFLAFAQSESCGKCVPCRVGTKQMLDILVDITQGRGRIEDLDLLKELGETVSSASLCALGGGAPNPVMSTLKHFYHEYEAHILQKSCPAGVCKALISFYINPEKCKGCLICLRACPAGAITGVAKQVHVINQEMCTKCGTCFDVCPTRFRAVEKRTGSVQRELVGVEQP